MKTTLTAKLGQQIGVTPQLLQSIRLLQLDGLHLEQEVRRMLESNPLLEREDDDAPVDEDECNPRAVIDEDESDYAWERGQHASGGGDDDDALARLPDRDCRDVRAHLLAQFRLEARRDADVALAALLLDHMDDSGYLEFPVDELAAAARRQGLPADGIEAVRRRLMHCEPVGCVARDL